MHRDGWLSTVPQLVLIEEAAFTVTMVIEDRVLDDDNSMDYSRDRYEVVGPVGQGTPRYFWLADHTGTMVEDPFGEHPARLTAKAQAALHAWLDWADDEVP
ncbi:MAG TPA: hypothetical protein VMU76_09235 [Acidimicrobiales bacterium]|nr:hypothetical protein [Acidimicrobiales bacterium]